jgi:hypothetical protein
MPKRQPANRNEPANHEKNCRELTSNCHHRDDESLIQTDCHVLREEQTPELLGYGLRLRAPALMLSNASRGVSLSR